MGEVRVLVKLMNGIDMGLVRRGQISSEQVRSCEVEASVDTGAVTTVIPRQIKEQLGLTIAGQRMAQLADGRWEVVDVTDPVDVEIFGRDGSSKALVMGDEVLIGQTILEEMDLQVDCKRRVLIPNPKHPDGPVLRV